MSTLFEIFHPKANVLFPLIVLNLPSDGTITLSSENLVDPSSETIKAHWTLQFLDELAEEMQVDSKFVSAYIPLIPAPGRDVTNTNHLREAFLNKLQMSPVDLVAFICHLTSFLMIGKFYDSRGRALASNLARTFGIDAKDFLFIERKLYHYFLTHVEEMKLLAETTEEKIKKRRAKYMRYAKIGVVTLGAGAVVAVTGGLAAPAIAAALVVMGTTSAAAAAATATTVACIFGGTAAGLSGYKMMKRTRGITEFEFEQYFEETMPSMMIVISGWQKRPEDYKRAMGVVPYEMTDRERLTRYYSCHCPDRLFKVDADLASFEQDINALYDQLQELYHADPREDSALVPPKKSLHPLPYAKNCLEAFLDEFNRQAEAIANKSSSSIMHLSPLSKASETTNFAEEDGASFIVSGNRTTILGSWDEDNIAQLQAAAEQHRHFQLQQQAQSMRSSSFPRASITSESKDTVVGQSNSANTSNDKKLDYDEDAACWHWQNLPESQAFSLYLLKWETNLQLELGDSISSMLKSMGASAVQDVLSVTLFTSLAAAAFWPVLLLQLTSIIDNLWTIAVERADLAGKELARALLNREHGSRPVTLVGYSMGARVIFSCLRELALQLHQDVNLFEDEQVPVTSTSEEVNVSSTSCAGTVSLADESAKTATTNADEKDATTVNGSSAEKEKSAASSTYTSSISNAGSSLFRMVRNTTSSIASTTSTVVSSAASTATSAFSSSSSSTNENDKNNTNQSTDKTGGSNPADKGATYAQKSAIRGLIEHVVLLGAPVSHKSRVWGAAREFVSGRIINGYSTKDMVLGVVYRYQRFQIAVSGVSPVELDDVQGIENFDLSDIVEKHTDYGQKLPQILRQIDLLRLRTNADLRVLSTMATSDAEDVQGTIEV